MLKDFSTKRPVRYGEKVIGCLEGRTFVKPVVGSKHRLNSPPAWAIDAEVFDQEVRPYATDFVVLDRESGCRYRCSVETFDAFKQVLDRGFGRQYFLTANHWRTDQQPDRPGEKQARQLAFAGMGV